VIELLRRIQEYRGTIRKSALLRGTSARRCETIKGWPSDELHMEFLTEVQTPAKDPRCSGYIASRWRVGLFEFF